MRCVAIRVSIGKRLYTAASVQPCIPVKHCADFPTFGLTVAVLCNEAPFCVNVIFRNKFNFHDLAIVSNLFS